MGPTGSSVLALCLGAAVALGSATPVRGEEPIGPKSCLYQADLWSTKVLDDRTILFTTRNRQTYSNQLPQHCPGMHRGSLLSYEFVSHRICSGSTFRVLLELGTQRMPTAVCPLGIFVPISNDEAETLEAATDKSTGGRRKRSERDAVRTEPAAVPAPAPAPVPDPAPPPAN